MDARRPPGAGARQTKFNRSRAGPPAGLVTVAVAIKLASPDPSLGGAQGPHNATSERADDAVGGDDAPRLAISEALLI
jgi:hypothetical protein